MAHEEAAAAGPSKLVIRNIGLMLSGDLARPILDADCCCCGRRPHRRDRPRR